MKFDRKIEEGFLDLFYTYKFKKKKNYKKINEILSELQLVISDSKQKELFLKDDYREYLEYCDYKLNEKLIEELNGPEIDTEYGTLKFNAYHEDYRTFNRDYKFNLDEEIISEEIVSIDKLKLTSSTKEELFVKEKLYELNNILNENSTYTGTDLEYLLKPYILQPIKIIDTDNENILNDFINVYLWVYTSGCITIQYTIPINNSNVENWIKTKEKKYSLNVKIPIYINNEKNSNEYIYSENIYDYEASIKSYNEFLFKNLDIKYFEQSSAYLELFTIGKYNNMPKDFKKSVHNEIKKDFFWIVNSPFGYINEPPENKYVEFFEKRYDINKYSSMFASTNYKILIAWNDSINTIDEEFKEYLQENYCNNERYYMSICYIIIPIHQLLMKKIYYNSTLNEPYNDLFSIKDIINKQKNLTYIKDYMFHVTGDAYGSLIEALNYLEDTMTNFLQSKAMNKKMEIYKEIVEARESEEKEKNNRRISFLALLVTVIFGVDAIDKITKLINTEFKRNLTSYNFYIWISLLAVLLIIFIYPKLKFKIKKKIICIIDKIWNYK